MGETIESFVAKLQAEGVEAGQQAAEKLLAEAKQQAEKIIQEANKQAERTLTDAKAKADSLLARAKTELDLAARDVVLRLREALEKALEAVLAESLKGKLANADFLARTLHDLVLLYAKADIERTGSMEINVPPELQEALTSWALKEMTKKAEESGMTIDLKSTLSTRGFEYSVSGATVEVTLESVIETISEMVSPYLAEVVEQAAAELLKPPENTEEPQPANSAAESS